jgi:hypothetical protein|tara:strand:+ start:337 stop:603 length:267 start_codon:yes stop_codon:yes gene_type:complete
MEEKIKFGELKAKELKIGDIVSWSKWNVETENWDEFMGVLLDTRNELVGNRLVSVSKVMPLNNNITSGELEFFTLSLKLVSHSDDKNK